MTILAGVCGTTRCGTNEGQSNLPGSAEGAWFNRSFMRHGVYGRWGSRLALTAAFLTSQPFPVASQTRDLSPLPQHSTIHWWHGVIAIGGLSVLMALDEPAQRYFQGQRSTTSNGLANTLRHFGQIEVYGTVTAGLMAAGLFSGDGEITRVGARLATSLVLTGASTALAKHALGRQRPGDNTEGDSDEYLPFSGHEAMPSGHTAIAFAMATSLADEIDRPWASLGLYTVASGVAWSRLNDNRHWLSDVAAGAALGITSAKLVNGSWRIFNLRPPRILFGPRTAALAWRLEF
jgi:membrane-associated phospholipid phosphatase